MDKQNCCSVVFKISRKWKSLSYLNLQAFLFRQSIGDSQIAASTYLLKEIERGKSKKTVPRILWLDEISNIIARSLDNSLAIYINTHGSLSYEHADLHSSENALCKQAFGWNIFLQDFMTWQHNFFFYTKEIFE